MLNKMSAPSPNDNLIDFPVPAAERRRERARRVNKAGRRIKFGACLTVGLVSLAVMLWGPQYMNIRDINAQIAELERQKQELQQTNVELKEDIRQLNNDAAVEKMAREKLGLVKPGEKTLIEVQ